MKTRIISGAVAIALLIALLVVNNFWSPISVIVISILSALASYEMLYNTGAVKNGLAILTAIVYSCAVQFSYSGILRLPSAVLTIVYVLLIAVLALKEHDSFKPDAITMCLSMPILISYAFSALESLLNDRSGFGLFYLIMLLNFSSIADCFAYFTGVAIGKHKLAPVISPKKTIEGAIGGVMGSVIGTLVICLIFNVTTDANANTLGLCLITPMMAVIGILGDLFTSAIKRTYGIKDYGNLMPGHGGVLDRCDSILFCAPVFALIVKYAGVIG